MEAGSIRLVLIMPSPGQSGIAERHAIHLRVLGVDKSSLAFNNADFDKVKAEFLALTRPTDTDAQVAQQRMPETRQLVTLRHYLAALQRPEAWAERIARRMNEHGRIGQPPEEARAYVRDEDGAKVCFDYADTRGGAPRRKELVLENLAADELRKLVIAVKLECKRMWPRKADLLEEIEAVWRASAASADTARQAVAAALAVPHLTVAFDKMNYEQLLIVLGALHGLAVAGQAAPQPELVTADADVPF